jgi:TnpA family transposase
VVFGLFWLLGYRFSPRMADIGGAHYWRIDPSADYGPLNKIAAHRINAKLIAEHWDDLLRLAGSLKLGVVQATSIMRTLQISDRPTRLAQAVAELGRIDKTIHALTFIDDESKRRRILQQLNKGEDVISWLEPYSTESEASSASDIVKDRKINLERLDWL